MNSTFYKLKVTNPCTEEWDNMTSTNAGRHCHSCNKEVIDFSVMSDEDVQLFLINNSSQGCGRFRNEQLERIRIQLPGNFFYKKIPVWQKYLAAFLICFGSHLFSLDITVGNNQGLHAQTPAVIVHTNLKKPIKKKKKKKKKDLFVFTDISITKMGFFAPVRQEMQWPLEEMITCVMPVTNPSAPIAEKNTAIDKKAFVKNNGNDKKQKTPPGKTPVPQKLEFILPSTTRIRGRKK